MRRFGASTRTISELAAPTPYGTIDPDNPPAKDIAQPYAGKVLSRLDAWYPASEVNLLDDSHRQAIAKMADAAQKEKLYVQCRMDSNSNLICMEHA